MSKNNISNHPQRSDVRKIDFLLKPKFTNTLPDIPFEGKFMPCPFVPITRFCEYKESTIEKEQKHSVICDDDMGLNVDLIDLDIYDEDKESLPTDDKDRYLLEDETASKLSQKRSAQHSRLVPWMRKTEYISTEYNRYGLSADRQETKLGYNLKKNQQVDDMYRDRQSQVDAINKTFKDVQKPVSSHYNKKGVYAVEESYIFPDFENWKNLYAFVQFDGESINPSIPENLRKIASEMSHIRGMQFGEDQFAALFTPTVETIKKQLEDTESNRMFDEDEKYEFTLNREYMWKSESSSQKGDHDNYIIHWKDNKASYNEIESNIKMTRKRKMFLSKKSKLTVQYRESNEEEMEQMQTRFENLFKPPQPNETIEEEEEDDDSENDSKGTKDGSSSDSDDDQKNKTSDSEDSQEEKNPKKRAPESSEDEEESD